MEIIIHALGMPFNGKTIFEKSLGGSETAAYYLARELAARGHQVTMFTTHPEEGKWDGVLYVNAGQSTRECPFGEKFHYYAANTPHDVLLCQRQPRVFHYQWASRINILQTHDLALFRYAGEVGDALWNLSAVTCVSAWHADQTSKVYPLPREMITVIPNGVDLEMYGEIPPSDKWAHDKDVLHLLYQSRPERGLEHLVRPGGIMDRLRDQPVHLHVCAYDYTSTEMLEFYQRLEGWASLLPNVSLLGALSKPDLVAVQKAMDLLVYPTEFEEVSCITAMEAMAAGLPFLSSAHAALPETCNGSGATLLALKDGKVDEDAFVEAIKARSADRGLLELEEQMQLSAAQHKGWGHVAQELEALMVGLLSKNAGNPVALVRSAIDLSDIDVAIEMQEACEATVPDWPMVRSAGDEIRELFAFRESDEAYAAHYAKHQGIYYDGPGADAVGEDVTGTIRFRGATLAASDIIKETGGVGLKILDYGCAHGHYLMQWAKVLHKSEFVGCDISERAIAAAMRWAQDWSLGNVQLVVGTQDYLRGQKGAFDIVYANEIIEHVPDYVGLIEDLRGALKPGGALIFTVPFGRWEWMGHESSKTGREHVHHFERADIEHIFEGHTLMIDCAPSGQDESGFPIGSWIVRVNFKDGLGIKPMDLVSKIEKYPSRQTMSVCLIVKDGENTIGPAIDSVAEYADEFVIGIDNGTTDGTVDAIDRARKRHPWKPITMLSIDSPMKVGFDEARNAVHDKAKGDWILWFDADEVVLHPERLHKYLKPSLINGVHFPQVHYSTEPAQVIATDKPCRLYRNNGTMRIYGMVHEHVEKSPGEAVPQAIFRDDVSFLHNGYITEEVRRKRFTRNMPLLVRDIEKYPDRLLNKFLMIRDLAQGIAFGSSSGSVMKKDAETAVKFFEELIDSEKPVTRLLIDSLQYYSLCVEILGTGFEAEMQFKTQRPPLATGTTIKGLFFNREHFMKLSNRLLKEATQQYEEKYF